MSKPFDLTMQHGVAHISLLFISVAYAPAVLVKLRSCRVSFALGMYKAVVGATYYVLSGYDVSHPLTGTSRTVHAATGACNTFVDNSILLLCSYVLISRDVVRATKVVVAMYVLLAIASVSIVVLTPEFLQDAADSYTDEWMTIEPLISAVLLYWFVLSQLFKTHALCTSTSANGSCCSGVVFAGITLLILYERWCIYTESAWTMASHAIRQLGILCVFTFLPRKRVDDQPSGAITFV